MPRLPLLIRRSRFAGLTLILVVCVGCQRQGLWTYSDSPGKPPVLCTPAQVLPFTLVIDASSSNPVWGRWMADGTRFDIFWPPGFTLAGSPDPALIDPKGKVVALNGQVIRDAGGSGGGPVSICSIGGTTY